MMKVTGLWECERKDGTKMYKGRNGKIVYLVFPVTDTAEKKPTFDLFIDQYKEYEG